MTRRRCLLVEALPYHWEVLPAWVGLLERLGLEVEVAVAGGAAGHAEMRDLLRSRCRTHPIDALPRLARGADFVVLNSLVSDGFFFSDPPVPRPDLTWIRGLGLPSISVIHEPFFWVEKRIVRCFRLRDARGERALNLLADGCAHDQFGDWGNQQWRFDGTDGLVLTRGEATRLFRTIDGGANWREASGDAVLVHRDGPDEDLARHVADGRHALVALSAGGARHLAPVFPGAAWILPFELQPRRAASERADIAFAGAIDYDRKNIASLLVGAADLPEGNFIRIVGGSRNADFENERFVRAFRAQIAEKGLESRFRFTGYLPYGAFLERVAGCRFLLPLLDDRMDGGAYLVKLSAAVASSLSHGVPLILHRRIAEAFDLGFMITYDGEDLASGLRRARALDDEGYAVMLAALDRRARQIDTHNLEVLGDLVDRLASRASEGRPS